MFRFAQHGLSCVANALCTRRPIPFVRKLQIRVSHGGIEEKPLGIKGLGQPIEFITHSSAPARERQHDESAVRIRNKPPLLPQKPHIEIRELLKIIQIRQDDFELGFADTKPSPERGGIFFNRDGRQQAAFAHISGGVERN
jgi:hypothetical protein